jgi:hypothetical protein
MKLTPEQLRQKIVAATRDLLADIKTLADETNGNEDESHLLICDLDDEIKWEMFSKLRTELTAHVNKTFIDAEEAYTEKHRDDAFEWIREHRHSKRDRDNLSAVFGLHFNTNDTGPDINFEEGDINVHISRRDHTGITRSRYLSDAEIVTVWAKETGAVK